MAGHGKQVASAVAPAVAEFCPATQPVHAALPLCALYVPALHAEHAASAAPLRSLVDDVVRISTPALRLLAVKAAELAAVAGEHAGPVARTIAERTDDAGHALARHATAFAVSHRTPPAESTTRTGEGSGPPV